MSALFASKPRGEIEETVMLDAARPDGSTTFRCPATLAVPRESAAADGGGVVLLHGWGGPRAGPGRLLVRWARRLASDGWLVLRPDLPGRGEAGGLPGAVDLDDMIACALSGLEALRRLGCARFVLGGICSGANAAAGAAAIARTPVERLALLSLLPFADIRESGVSRAAGAPFPPPDRHSLWAKRGRRLAEYGRKALSPSTWLRLWRGEIDFAGVGRGLAGGRRPGAPALEPRNLKDSRLDLPARWASAGRRTPALLVYGAADPEARGAAAWYESFFAAHGIERRVILVPGADHNFSGRPWADAAIAAASDWCRLPRTGALQ